MSQRPRVDVPAALAAKAANSPDWRIWLERLPRLAADLVLEWELELDGEARHGSNALVLPVRTVEHTPAALKIGWPHWEAETEHLALQAWGSAPGQSGDGGPAVRLLRADPHRFALLLERAGEQDLNALPVLTACEVVAGTYAELHRPALPQLKLLSDLCRGWTDTLEALQHRRDVPRRFVVEAVSYLRSFADDPATDGRLLHTDLHYDNVLSADRRPWLVIDPKPLSGDPHYEIAPLLWNRWEEVLAAPRARDALLDRFYAVVDTAGLDEDRARAWVVVREMVNVAWALSEPAGDDFVKVALTIVKAVHV